MPLMTLILIIWKPLSIHLLLILLLLILPLFLLSLQLLLSFPLLCYLLLLRCWDCLHLFWTYILFLWWLRFVFLPLKPWPKWYKWILWTQWSQWHQWCFLWCFLIPIRHYCIFTMIKKQILVEILFIVQLPQWVLLPFLSALFLIVVPKWVHLPFLSLFLFFVVITFFGVSAFFVVWFKSFCFI
jgi:hypothetical protein